MRIGRRSRRYRVIRLGFGLAALILAGFGDDALGEEDWQGAQVLCDMIRSQGINCPARYRVEVQRLTETRRQFVRAIAKLHPITLFETESGLYYALRSEHGGVRIAEKYYYKQGPRRFKKPYDCMAVNPGGSIFGDPKPYKCEMETPLIKMVYYSARGSLF